MTESKPRSPALAKASAGIGRVLLWGGGSLWIGRGAGRGDTHAHHAIQIALGLSGPIQLRGSGPHWQDYTGAIVLPHGEHQFDGNSETVAQIFVEPETAPGRWLIEHYAGGGIHSLPDSRTADLRAQLLAAFNAGASDAELVAAAQAFVQALCGNAQTALQTDPRITNAIAFVRERLHTAVTLDEAAAVAHLSPSRFRHLFVAQTGMAFRTYLLWARVEAAVGAAMNGMSWTEAAHTWGFADSAHLSRTCRRMFGIAPTMIAPEGKDT